jgi:hypothetical protein
MIESNQLKSKIFVMSNTQEADQKLLENISKMILDASSVIAKYLNIWLRQTICNRMIDRPCNFVYHKLHFPFSVSFCLQFLDDPFSNSGQIVPYPNSTPTATQSSLSTEYNSAWIPNDPTVIRLRKPLHLQNFSGYAPRSRATISLPPP